MSSWRLRELLNRKDKFSPSDVLEAGGFSPLDDLLELIVCRQVAVAVRGGEVHRAHGSTGDGADETDRIGEGTCR